MSEGRLSLPLAIYRNRTRAIVWIKYEGPNRESSGTGQKKVEETVGGLLKGMTKPEDLKQQGQDLLKGLLGR